MKETSSIPALLTSLLCLATSLSAQQAATTATSQGRGFDLSVGVSARQFGDLSLRSGSSRQSMAIPLYVAPGGSSGDPDAVGPADAISDRTYVDGFVNIGTGTAVDGLTTFWGYNDAAQVSGDTLTFTSAPYTETTSTVTDNTAALEGDYDTGTRYAPEIEIGYRFYVDERTVLRAVAGFSWSQLDQDQSGSNFGQIQNSQTNDFVIEDRYALDGILPPLPGYVGTVSGPGPLIENIPTRRMIQSLGISDSQNADIVNQIRDRVDLDIYSFNAGLEAQTRLSDAVWLSGGAGLVLNAVDLDSSHRETLSVSQNGGAPTEVASWRDNHSSFETSWGFYAKTGLAWQIAQQWSLNGYLRYDWNESVTGDVGPGSFSLDMDVLTLGAALQFRF